MKVLVVEDGRTTRMMLRSAVETLGHECLTAADGSEAWEIFRAQGADVIISDWLMPGIEGPELCRRVRGHVASAAGQAPYTYFILLTVLVRLILFPLTAKQAKSMIAMQRAQPEIKKLQAKYKNDRQKLNEEMMKFYKENNINPLAGCLPLLLQLPLFIVLYRVIAGLTATLILVGVANAGTTSTEAIKDFTFTTCDTSASGHNGCPHVTSGTVENGVFVGKPGSMMTKCPSKYQAAKNPA